ncbi:hypothetical protein ACE1CI_14570 [Aerosakkonemataceae cyanobacterium BLCC-F50]|uniref:Flagellar assembly protein H n=1 Tax=Floridaenema flaviceps BLCC-F50 TaxID=3153642 RepID=A0ABV4XQY4_9CYAN
MTRFIHDQFAKDYLEKLLTPYGVVQAPRRVAGEVREIDVWFAPNSQQNSPPEALGLLGRLATTISIFEPYRNAASDEEIGDCLLKILEVRGELRREANRNNTRLQESDLPRLWIITPTASENLLSQFGAIPNQDWVTGIYFLPSYFRSAIIAVHQLPPTTDTLWLRILGKGNVQKRAIDELESLPVNNPYRAAALELLYNLQRNLQANQVQVQDEEDRELIMRLAPLYQQDREQAMQQGVQEGERLVVENLLRVRFGSLDAELLSVIDRLLSLPPEELSTILLQLSNLSREELIARFESQNS